MNPYTTEDGLSRSFGHMLPLKPYLSVVDYPNCHTALLLVVRDAEAVN
jgi:hypothetical protein